MKGGAWNDQATEIRGSVKRGRQRTSTLHYTVGPGRESIRMASLSKAVWPLEIPRILQLGHRLDDKSGVRCQAISLVTILVFFLL